MSDPLWLADVLRAAGLQVVEYPGWRDRGHGDFGNIWGVVMHHTGSNPPSNCPQCIAEHPELGLASQLHLSRGGVYTVLGAGIAWHAGAGSYPGIAKDNANQVTIGIEAENNGTEGWGDAQYDAYMIGVAAILNHIEQPYTHAIGHKEWAGASQGKWDPGGMDMNIARSAIRSYMEDEHQESDMATPEEIAAAVWAHRLDKPDGKSDETAGNLLSWTDKHGGEALDQAAGPGTKDQRGVIAPTGWPQLGKTADGKNRSVVDAIASVTADVLVLGARLKALDTKLDTILALLEVKP